MRKTVNRSNIPFAPTATPVPALHLSPLSAHLRRVQGLPSASELDVLWGHGEETSEGTIDVGSALAPVMPVDVSINLSHPALTPISNDGQPVMGAFLDGEDDRELSWGWTQEMTV